MKFMDYVNVNPIQSTGAAYHNWPYFRYAEMLLNLAEAGNESGGPTYVADGAKLPLTPVQALDLIRERAGMPKVLTTFATRGVALTQASLRS